MDAYLEHFVTHVGGCGTFQWLLGAVIYLINMASMFRSQTFGNSTTELAYTTTTYTSSYFWNNTTVSAEVTRHADDDRDVCDVAKSCQNITFNPEASTLISEWGLICDKSWYVSVVISVQMAGLALGAFSGGYLSNRFGRKAVLYSLVALCGVTNFISVFSTSIVMFGAIRFFIGLSVGGMLCICQVYPMEFVTAKWRPFIAGFPASSTANIALGVLMLLTKDWRYIHLATALVSALGFLTIFWMPESMRWLAVQNKIAQAYAVGRKICKYNRRPPPEEPMEFLAETEVVKRTDGPGIRELFGRRFFMKTVFGFTIFFTLSLVYYSIGFGVKVLFGNFYVNFILFAVFTIPPFPFVPIIGNRFGRRKSTASYFCAACVISTVLFLLHFTVGLETLGMGVTITSLAIVTTMELAWSTMIAFTSELFPTYIRALGSGVVFTGARAGGIVSPYLIPDNPESLYVAYIVIAACTAVCSALTLGLPETRHRQLGDTPDGELTGPVDTDGQTEKLTVVLDNDGRKN
ncbi:solute carrier family 22 member 7-like [Aplysia californica]|uniref:Solute carrier family 22 member 7-like n=1 Tax=Aplysia californica TaxID=6500 RepID=A0ABM1ACJ7_APLCA|nr:solute carrier family 22 member 7-like [Aplysia californica]